MLSRRRTALALGSLAVALIGGCESAAPSLFVDVRTDFLPGVEFVFIDIVLAPGSSSCEATGDEIDRPTHPVSATDASAYPAGSRVGGFDGLAPGTYILRGLLRRAAATPGAPIDSGEVLARRCVVASLSSSRVVEVPFQSSCHGVSCPPGGAPALTSCVQGECVDPRCDIADETARRTHCDPDGFCATDADCATASRCAPSRCVISSSGAGLCIVGDDVEGSCGAGEYCSRESGDCEPLPGTSTDAGLPDAPRMDDPDAGMDAAALDASASEDAWVPDAPAPLDAPASTDAFALDARIPDAPSALDAFVRSDAFVVPDAFVRSDAFVVPDAGRDAWAADAFSMDACSATFANCDGTPGCEADLLSDESNCGACGVACGMNEVCYGDGRCRCGSTPGTPAGGAVCDDYLAHATGRCSGAATPSCVIVTCDSGWGNCDGLGYTGCEANLASPTTCGTCTLACVTGETCSGGTCRCNGGAACSAGQVCRTCGCVPATETICRTITGDEDCDGFANCADPDCTGRMCSGVGTMCVSGSCI